MRNGDELIRAIEECIYKLDNSYGERAQQILISKNLEREFMEESNDYSANVFYNQNADIKYRGISLFFSEKIDASIVSVLGEKFSMSITFQKFLFDKQNAVVDRFYDKFLEILRR